MLRQTILTGLVGFDRFWDAYLKKVAKKEATKAWLRLNPNSDLQAEIQTALAWQFQQESWLKDGCQYAPNAATYLRGERWCDRKPVCPKTLTANRLIVKGVTSDSQQQQDAVSQMQFLIRRGMSPEEAKRQVYLAKGWIKEDGEDGPA